MLIEILQPTRTKKKRLRSKKEKKEHGDKMNNFNSHTHTYTQTHQDTEFEQLSKSWIHGPKPIRPDHDLDKHFRPVGPWNHHQNFIIKIGDPWTQGPGPKKFRSSKIGPSRTRTKYC